MAELLRTFPELPLLLVVLVLAVLSRRVRLVLLCLAAGLVAAMALGAVGHEVWAALAGWDP